VADLSGWGWIALIAAALVVGFAKTAISGATVVAVVVFANVLPARESTATLLILLLVGDVMALVFYRRHADWRTLVRLTPSVLVGIGAGAAFLLVVDDLVVRRTIGAIILALVVLSVALRHRARPVSTSVGARLGYGSLGGFTTMVANAGGPVMSMYLVAARFDVMTFLGTTAWFFACVNLAKLPFAVGLGVLTPAGLMLDVFLAPVVVTGAFVGRVAASRVEQRVFERVVIWVTVAGAGYLLLS
jgi:uncharacterized membrane protein YfcA